MPPPFSRVAPSKAAIPGLALVDYGNVRGRRQESHADFELHARDLIDALVHAFRCCFSDIQEVDVRFYGGWTDELGQPSRDHLSFLQVLPRLRGRRHGLIVRPALATAMLQFPDLIPRGTVRFKTQQQSRKPHSRQKMVDSMLGCDAMFATVAGVARVGVVTDDDDLVPAALSANAANLDLTIWMRRRRTGTGLNDRSLINRGLRFRQID